VSRTRAIMQHCGLEMTMPWRTSRRRLAHNHGFANGLERRTMFRHGHAIEGFCTAFHLCPMERSMRGPVDRRYSYSDVARTVGTRETDVNRQLTTGPRDLGGVVGSATTNIAASVQLLVVSSENDRGIHGS